MDEEKDIALIVSFLEGTLSPGEKTELEKRLALEPDLQLLLQDMKILKLGIRQTAREDMRSELQALEQKLAGSGSWMSSGWLKIAASLAIVAITSWLLWPTATMTPQQLFAENFEAYPNIIMPTVRGTEIPNPTVSAQAYKAYDMQEYAKAIALFESLEDKDEGVLLYLGISYLANGSPEKAIPIFEKAIRDFDMFEEQAGWYLALAFLNQGNYPRCSALLNKLVVGNTSYSEKARKLLPNLKQ